MNKVKIKYNKAGLKTLPLNDDKTPASKHWLKGVDKGYKDKGIGVVCGKISGGLEVLDFDNHFGDAKENLSAFMREIKDINEKRKFPVASTVNGGFHIFYKCPKPSGNTKLASRPRWNGNRFVPDAIIESRGESGYITVEPTRGYKMLRGDILNIPTVTNDERDEMWLSARLQNKWHKETLTDEEKDNLPGNIFNHSTGAVDEMKDCLIKHGWREVRDGLWRRPEKEKGTSATLGKVAEGIFYNFSSNAYPFEPMKAYTAFQVIALLDYDGNFSRFAAILTDRFELSKPKMTSTTMKAKLLSAKEVKEIIKTNIIDLSIPVEKPPIIMKVKDFEFGALYKKRLFTLGNFSCITGKSKSKKTFFCTCLLAGILDGSFGGKLYGNLPYGKSAVILFDTEQSAYDSYVTAKRIPDMIGDKQNFAAIKLREFSPAQRCQIIEGTFEMFRGQIGFAVIDGIADLVYGNNDEEESTRVTSLLMKLTTLYDAHIVNVIHQNKNDNMATGHIGSSIMKKSECIISIERNMTKRNESIVHCDMMRGSSEFSDFSFCVNDKGLPEINEAIDSNYKVFEDDL